MERRVSPKVEFIGALYDLAEWDAEGGWYTVKIATPAVTAKTMRYFESE